MFRAPSLALILLLVLSPLAVAQDKPGSSPDNPIRPVKAPPLPDVENEQYAAYWTVEPGWHTDIELRNNLKERELRIAPTLYLAGGGELQLAPVTIKPDDVQVLDLRDALSVAAPGLADTSGAFGSLVFKYSSPFPHNLYVGSMVQREGSPIAFHFDGAEPDEAFNAGTREGIWWLPTPASEAYLVIANASAKNADVKVNLYSQSGMKQELPVPLLPRQTRRLSIRELTVLAGITETSGGLTVAVPKDAESVYAAQFVFDASTGFSALMKTFERTDKETPHEVVLRAPMLALSKPDPALYLPPGTILKPLLFLRNASPRVLPVKAALRWRTETRSGNTELGTFRLQNNALTNIDLYGMQQDGKIPRDASWATVSISYHGRYGDLVAIAASYELNGRYGLQTPFTDLAASRWVGSQWFSDSLRSSIITVGNATDKPTVANLTLYYNRGTGKYEIEQELNPGEQIWLDVARTIRNRLPDKNGQTIPLDVQQGSYTISDVRNLLGKTLFEGKLTIDKKFGHASYGCGNCCDTVAGSWLTPNPFSGAVGGWWQNILWGYNSCGDYSEDLTALAYNWTTTDGNVTTVSSSGLGHAVGAGSANTFTSIVTPSALFKCPYRVKQSQGPANVKPRIDSISPPRGIQGGTTSSVTIRGAGLTSGTVSAGTGITVNVSSHTSTTIVASFVAAGYATPGSHSVTVTAGGQWSNALSFFVQVPAASRITQTLSDHTLDTGNSPCASGQAGWYRQVQKIITDQVGADIVASGQTLSESVTIGSPNGLNIAGIQTGTAVTNAGGSFTDTFYVCTPLCPASSGQTNASQMINDTLPTGGASCGLTPNALVYKCSNISVNGQ